MGFSFFTFLTFVSLSFSGSFILDVANPQPEEFHCRVIVRELSAVLTDFAELVVQRLDRVSRVNDAAQLGRELQDSKTFVGFLPQHVRVK